MTRLGFLWAGLIAVVLTHPLLAKNNDEYKGAEAAYLDFITALVNGDWEKAKRMSLPHPDWDLLKGAGPMPEIIREQFLEGVRKHGYQVLAPGDAVEIGEGLEIRPNADFYGSGGVIVTSPADPLPHILKKVDGTWLADAGDLIALRKDWLASEGESGAGKEVERVEALD